MDGKEKEGVLSIVEELRDACAGEASHVADWIETMIENIEAGGGDDDYTATDLIISSLHELISHAESTIKSLEDKQA